MDRLDRIETAIERLTADIAELTASVRITDEIARRGWQAHLDSRADIQRLYEAWPDHLRHPRPNGHGDAS